MSKLDKLFIDELDKFKRDNPYTWHTKISEFLDKFRIIYERYKFDIYIKSGFNSSAAQNKARNSWVAYLGAKLEDVVLNFLGDFCKVNNIAIVKGKLLKNCNNDEELSKVRRKIEVSFNEFSLLPDADLVLYKLINDEPEIISIISVKKSFRERYTETPYWKLKLLQDKVTEKIKVFMVTPDKEGEISFVKPKPRQARIVMEYELDSIYLLKDKFHKSAKVKIIDEIFRDLERISKITK